MDSQNSQRGLRILLLEDDPCDAELLAMTLQQATSPCVVTSVTSRQRFESELQSQPPDVILSDSNIPGFDGLSALAMARKQLPSIPFILISGSISEKTRIAALDQGVTDFISKNDLLKIVAAIKRLKETRQNGK